MVIIYGGGFAGLSLAHELARRKIKVHIVEQSSRLGGVIKSPSLKSGVAEEAATTIVYTKNIEKLMRELGLSILASSKTARKRYFYKDHLSRWPIGFWATIKFIYHFAKAKFSNQIFPREEETIHDWGLRVFGQEVTNEILRTGLQGIHPADIHQLDAELVLADFLKKKREKYRGVISIQGGIEQIINALEFNITRNEGLVTLNKAHLENEDSASHIVYCVSPKELPQKIKHHYKLEDLADKTSGLGLTMMTLFFDQPNPMKAFGCLVHPETNFKTRGVLLNHHIFPGKKGYPSETWMLKHSLNTDQGVMDEIMKERKQIFNLDNSPVEYHRVDWGNGLPLYDKHLKKLIHSLPNQGRIRFHGQWYGSMGLSKILNSSIMLATQIESELRRETSAVK